MKREYQNAYSFNMLKNIAENKAPKTFWEHWINNITNTS